MTDKIKLVALEKRLNNANYTKTMYKSPDSLVISTHECAALSKAVRAAKGVIDFVNPMFCDTDECLVKLRENLSPFDWSEDD